MGTEYLEVRGLTVDFDGFKAVSDVDLTLFQGDLRFLIGPNGAGKTTVIDAITGLVPATGSVEQVRRGTAGQEGAPDRPARASDGPSRPPASSKSSPCCRTSTSPPAPGRSWWTLLRRRSGVLPGIEEALETIGLTDLADKPAGVLAHGQKQWLEIGMLLVQNADVLLLDEPVAGMSHEEREETGNLLRRIGAERTVVVVEHDMDFMRAFATSVTVLAARPGHRRGHGRRGAGQSEGAGGLPRHRRGGADRDLPANSSEGDVLMLELVDVRTGYGRSEVIHGVSIEVPPDGVAAVMGHNGAGKTTLLRAAVGPAEVHCGQGAVRRRGRHQAAARARGWPAGWPTCRRASSRSVS